MTGMKEGAGEDPFAEDTEPPASDPDPSPEPEVSEETDETPVATNVDTTPESTESGQSTQTRMQIPYKYRRDSVQDGRDRVPLFLQPETKTAEREALRELEERFGDNVSLTDLREALVKVGLEHLDETEERLEEWGYGMTFD
ncbi:hypothetical protein [Halohasta salina]|uniref:hypothetical protein n=1 Tax=Halohasta salina TaxID=2961621 RepID=UPI0020A49C66|nr:hypothetical protein [Halohasta salina]